MKKWLGVVAISISLFSCGTDDPVVEPSNQDYFPLVTGSYYLYKVDSIDFEKRPYDTTKFWLRENIGEEIDGLNGEKYYEISVLKKYAWEDDWLKIKTDLARVTQEFAERYTENIYYIKQTFPMSTKVTWDATPYNDISFLYGPIINFDEARFERIHDYHILGDRGYDSTAHLVLYSGSNLISRLEFQERYASRVGLYKKFELNADFQPVDPESSDTSAVNYQPNSGYKYVQTLVDYKIPQ